jgi:hypothetical protein
MFLDGWMDGKAILRNAYSNQKYPLGRYVEIKVQS